MLFRSGGVVGGGITFVSFKPCCERLKNVLKDTRLSNPEHNEDENEMELVANIVDTEYEVL